MLRHDLQPVGEVLKRPPTNRGSATTSNPAFPPEDPLFPSANSLSTTTQHQEYTSRLASDLLGKYNRVDFPPPLYQQDIWYPGNLLEVIKFILSIECPPMQEPEFQFQFSQEAAHHNWDTLSKYDNLGQALEATSNTQLSYGSEFRDPNLLQLIFLNHPLWKCLKQQLQEGVSYPSIELPENASRQDLLDAFEFGNHKGVGKNKEFFQNAMKEEVLCGWQLPIPRQKVLLIKGALMSPMNVVEQKSINEKGEIIDKQRLTHDQGMKFSSGTSVNSRVIEEEIQDPMYGFCLLRIIHTIIDFRLRFPSKRIFMNKIDYKAAYRRSHLNWKLAIQTITQCTDSNLAFIALRMTFGGAPNPSFWGNISESVIDLANALLQCKEWDPSTLHSPLQHRLPTEPKQSPNSKLATALPIDVDVLPSDNGKADIYIDDGITITVEKDDEDLSNLNKAAAAVLLAMHVVGRPDDEKDPIKRKNLCSLSKLAAEGTLAEMLVILGWQIDSRLLLVILPYDKFKAWTTSIEQMISSKRSSFKELESTVGRLGHVTFIIPYMKHFMSRIRAKMKQAQNRRHIKLNSEVVEDLKLHLQFLKFAHEGINMNLITFRKVTHVYRTDACPFGIGGYSHKGRAWRFYIPKNLQFRMTLNMLEFVASIISPWVDILEGNLPPFSCILSLTDSSTTAGWLHKSNFQESETEHPSLSQAKLKLARDHALRIFTQQCKDYSQWFPGDENDLADSLSHSQKFTDISAAARNRIISLLNAAESSRKHATTRKTQDEQHRAWSRWKQFIKEIGLSENDIFLDQLPQQHRTIILSAFIQAVRDRHFSSNASKPLVCQTVRATLDNLCKTFRDYDRPNPKFDSDKITSRLLQQQLKGYKDQDPPEKHQKAIPMSVIRSLHSLAKDNLDSTLADLMTMAIFWCMRSCEYLQVNDQKDRKTKILCLRNFRFFNNQTPIQLNSPFKYEATVLTITFEDQKNREKFDSVTCHRTEDLILCPIKSSARLIDRILLSTPNVSYDTQINSFSDKNKIIHLTNTMAIKFLRHAVKAMGSELLGFTPNEVGTHSIRSGGAMALCLSRVDQYIIQIWGRWKSDAFMKYIRKQVEQFTAGLSSLMLKNENFNHISAFRIN